MSVKGWLILLRGRGSGRLREVELVGLFALVGSVKSELGGGVIVELLRVKGRGGSAKRGHCSSSLDDDLFKAALNLLIYEMDKSLLRKVIVEPLGDVRRLGGSTRRGALHSGEGLELHTSSRNSEAELPQLHLAAVTRETPELGGLQPWLVDEVVYPLLATSIQRRIKVAVRNPKWVCRKYRARVRIVTLIPEIHRLLCTNPTLVHSPKRWNVAVCGRRGVAKVETAVVRLSLVACVLRDKTIGSVLEHYVGILIAE